MFELDELIAEAESDEEKDRIECAFKIGFDDGVRYQQKDRCGKCRLYYGRYPRANFQRLVAEYAIAD